MNFLQPGNQPEVQANNGSSFQTNNNNLKDNVFFQNIKSNVQNWNYFSPEMKSYPNENSLFGNTNINTNNTIPEPERRLSTDSSLSSNTFTSSRQNSNSSSSNNNRKKKKRGRIDDPDFQVDDYNRSKKIIHEGFLSLSLSANNNNNNTTIFPMNPPTTTANNTLDSLFTSSQQQQQPQQYPGFLSKMNSLTSENSEYSLNSDYSRSNLEESDEESLRGGFGEDLRKKNGGSRKNYLLRHKRHLNQDNNNSNNNNYRQQPSFSSSSRPPTPHHKIRNNTPVTPILESGSMSAVTNNTNNTNNQTTGGDDSDSGSTIPTNYTDPAEKELFTILKNGKRQYNNPVDYYVDELIRKSRKTDESTSSRNPSDYFDDGFINATMGPQPTTDHALSLFVVNPSSADPLSTFLTSNTSQVQIEDEDKDERLIKESGFRREGSSDWGGGLFYDDLEQQRGFNQQQGDEEDDDGNNSNHNSSRSNFQRKKSFRGDITHNDWLIEEVDPDEMNISEHNLQTHNNNITSANKSNNNISMSTSQNPSSASFLLTDKSLYSSFPQRRFFQGPHDTTSDSVHSNSRDYGSPVNLHISSNIDKRVRGGGMTYQENEVNSDLESDLDDDEDDEHEVNDEDDESNMACCEDWSNLSSNEEYDEDDEAELNRNTTNNMTTQLSMANPSSTTGDISNNTTTVRKSSLKKPKNRMKNQTSFSVEPNPHSLFHHPAFSSNSNDHNDPMTTDSDEMMTAEEQLGSESQGRKGIGSRENNRVIPPKAPGKVHFAPLFHSVSDDDDDESEDVINVGTF
jgi:hypothetical protein